MFLSLGAYNRKDIMEMQIFDVDYVNMGERPIIRIFGRTNEGKSACGFYKGFLPYFYVKGEAGLEFLKDKSLKIEKVKRKEVFNPPAEFYKVTISNPAKTPELREALKKMGVEVYEADILFKYRFMNDCGLGGMGWINMEGNNESTKTVNVDRPFTINKIKTVERDDVPMRILSFDIECVPLKEGNVPEARRDPVIMLSVAFHPNTYKGQKNMVLATKPIEGAEFFESEKELLEEFVSIVNEYDPDVMTGFNVNNFDFPYILERMNNNRVRPIFGRCQSKGVFAKKLGNRYKVGITGRIIADSFDIIKKDFSLQRYGLDFVSKALLKKEKVGVKHSEINKLWKGDDNGLKKLVEYSRKDSTLAMDLIVELQLLDKYVALSKIAGTLPQDTLEGGETIRIEHFLLREFNKEGYVFPCRPSQQQVGERDKRKKKELVGGYVIEPEKNLHSNVAVLDFVSMYPSIIRTFNICPTTLTKEGGEKSPSGAMFVSPEEKQGIVPRILEHLMNERQATKKKMKKVADPEKKRVLYAKQWALKILANAFYGHMGYSRARVYNMDVANSITSYGREIISNTVKRIEKKFGYRIVYGDTDSVFVVIPEEDLEKIAEKAHEISSYISKGLPGIMKLDFEKDFKRFLPLTKKRYVAWKFVPTENGWEEGIEMKGIETVRRDWCGLVGDTMSNVINIILKKNDIKGAVSCFKEVVDDLVGGKIPIQKLVVTKTMTKPVKNYLGIQPHIELVKKVQARSPEEAPGIGDRIPFVIVKGTDLLSKRAEDPMYVVENGLDIDSNYYVENQLLPPLERIFIALGISKSELLGNGKQIGIMDVLRNQAKKKAEIKQIDQKDVTGYVCEKCSAFYPHIPLLGVCTCGGRILFASKKGQASVVNVN